MAEETQLKLAKSGAKAWNKWRADHPKIRPDLTRAHLIGANLFEAKLTDANLTDANLIGVNLAGADLVGARMVSVKLHRANLADTKLAGANLTDADLTGADLTGADLSGVDLSGTTMSGSNLSGADLSGADLSGANLSNACLKAVSFRNVLLYHTVFDFTSLNAVEGLETCVHLGPSTLGFQTLMESAPLPEIFLRGCGLSKEFIDYLPSFWNEPLQFYSCFISYSHADAPFARRLHDTLQGRGIRCWLDEHQLLLGDDLHPTVDNAIRLWDKVLLCASEASLTSWWVDREFRKALMKEEQLSKERGKPVLAIIPLNLDGQMFKPDWHDWKKETLTSRLAADFTGWKNDDDKFNRELEKVIKALRADARPPGPMPKL